MIAVAQERLRINETTPADALVELLDQLELVLMEVPTEIYHQRFSSVSGSIGEHVRHLLDHVEALIGADPCVSLTYDSRRRGTSVEVDPAAAIRQILSFKAALDVWSMRSLGDPIYVSALVARGEHVAGWSTLGRELAFVVNHTTHHQAMIGVLLAIHGYAVPERFGHAPSTPMRH